MSRTLWCATVVALMFFACLGEGHVCLMDPPQRGGFNVSDPGDISCFQPMGPCGTVPASTPTVVLEAGAGYPIFLQQNLNHYNPGWPGFIDVAWAVGPNPLSSDFKTLATIPDYWPHLQAQQTNFTVVVSVPPVSCPHCVIRVRYDPNKPTEPIFHNCADVRIVKPIAPPAKGSLFGFAQDGYWGDSYFVSIAHDGTLTRIAPIPVRLSAPKRAISGSNVPGLANGAVAVDKSRQRLMFLGYNTSSSDALTTDAKPTTLYRYDIASNQFLQATTLTNPDPINTQWVALVSNFGGQTFPAFTVGLVKVAGQGFSFQVRSLDSNGGVSAPIGTFPFDTTFVNYFWAEYDDVRQQLYILSGDENSLFELNVRLYVLNTKTGQVSYVTVDNSLYTITSIHVDTSTGNLYALSPGLLPQQELNLWSLVQINPTNGRVSLVGNINSDAYTNYYGGGVYGAALSNSIIFHQFVTADSGATVLGMVDVATGKLRSTTAFNTGINNAITLNTVAYVPSP